MKDRNRPGWTKTPTCNGSSTAFHQDRCKKSSAPWLRRGMPACPCCLPLPAQRALFAFPNPAPQVEHPPPRSSPEVNHLGLNGIVHKHVLYDFVQFLSRVCGRVRVKAALFALAHQLQAPWRRQAKNPHFPFGVCGRHHNGYRFLHIVLKIVLRMHIDG